MEEENEEWSEEQLIELYRHAQKIRKNLEKRGIQGWDVALIGVMMAVDFFWSEYEEMHPVYVHTVDLIEPSLMLVSDGALVAEEEDT